MLEGSEASSLAQEVLDFFHRIRLVVVELRIKVWEGRWAVRERKAWVALPFWMGWIVSAVGSASGRPVSLGSGNGRRPWKVPVGERERGRGLCVHEGQGLMSGVLLHYSHSYVF